MTKAGFGFIVAGGFVYLIASQTQIGWLYLLDAVIWASLVLSAILPCYSLKSVQVERQIILPACVRQSPLGGPVEDDTVEVKLRLTNGGRMARHFIKVLEDCPFDEPEKRHKAFLVTSLNPRSTTVFSYTATCYRRGFYTSSNITLQSSGPLGLMARRRTFPLPVNLTVYPAYYQMEGLPVADFAWMDWGRASKSRAGNEFYGSREHQHGEPLKYIHWRNTARLGHFMVKEFEQTTLGSVTVAFETGRDFGTGRETTVEYSIKIAASLAKLCADSGQSIDIIAGKTPWYHAGWQEAMDYLARLETGGNSSLATLTSVPQPGQIVVVIVPAAEAELVPILLRLAERIKTLVVVILEGFTPDETADEFASGLRESNLDIVSCARGNLEAAIKKLGNSLVLASKLPAAIG